MPRSGAVNELTGEVAHLVAVEKHAHAARCSDIGHMGYLYIIGGAKGHEGFLAAGFHHHGHAFLALADGQFRGIEAGVLHGHAVQPDVQAGRQLANGYAHAAGAKVVGFLDEARHFRAAEQPLQLALFGGVALLHLAAAGFQRSLRVLLGRSRGSANAVASRASAQKEDHIARGGAFAAHIGRLHGAHYGANFHALGGIARRIDLPHMGGGQTNLVAVAGIAAGRLAGNHPLGQFAGDGGGYRSADVTGARHAHGLIDIGPAGERVADGTAQASGSAAKGLYFCGMVMGFVLELQQPFLHLPIHIHVHKDAAGIVFFALLQVVQLTLLAQPAGSNGGQFHQAHGLPGAAQFFPHLIEEVQGSLQLGLHEALVHGDFFQLGGKGGMTAVVAPVGVQDAQLGFRGVAAFAAEVEHYLAQVVGVHGQAVRLAEGAEIGLLHLRKACQVLQGLHGGLLCQGKDAQVFAAAFYRIDVIMGDALQHLRRHFRAKDQQAGAFDLDIGLRGNEVHAVYGRRSALVKLAGDVLHRQVRQAAEVQVAGDRVCDYLAEHAVAALLHQGFREAKKVVHVDEPERSQVQGQVLVQVGQQAGSLYPELLFLFYE